MDEVTLAQGLPAGQRRPAAELLFAAFASKFGPLLGSRRHAVALFAACLQPDRAISARRQGELVGLAGLHHGAKRFLEYRWPAVRSEYGLLGALPRALILRFIASPDVSGELWVDFLAVAEGHRGCGIGTSLLHEVFAFAQAEGMQAVRLDVVDTNPGARRLYERLGFVPVSTVRQPLLFRPAGFTALTTMRKALS
jgi:ribosomal protein S18 acetylase RimI-like enzyme